MAKKSRSILTLFSGDNSLERKLSGRILGIIFVIAMSLPPKLALSQSDFLLDSTARVTFFLPSFSIVESQKFFYDSENRISLVRSDDYYTEYIYEDENTTVTTRYKFDDSEKSKTSTDYDEFGRITRIENYDHEFLTTYDSIIYDNEGFLKLTYVHLDNESWNNGFLYQIKTDSFNSDSLLVESNALFYTPTGEINYNIDISNKYDSQKRLIKVFEESNSLSNFPNYDSLYYIYDDDILVNYYTLRYKGPFFEESYSYDYDHTLDSLITTLKVKYNDIDQPYQHVSVRQEKKSQNNSFFAFDDGIENAGSIEDLGRKITSFKHMIEYSNGGDTVKVRKEKLEFDLDEVANLIIVLKEIWTKEPLLLINKVDAAQKVSLYPIPANTNAPIFIKSAREYKSYTLYDSQGMTISSGLVLPSETPFIMSPTHSGNYFLTLHGRANNNSTVIPIVIH